MSNIDSANIDNSRVSVVSSPEHPIRLNSDPTPVSAEVSVAETEPDLRTPDAEEAVENRVTTVKRVPAAPRPNAVSDAELESSSSTVVVDNNVPAGGTEVAGVGAEVAGVVTSEDTREASDEPRSRVDTTLEDTQTIDSSKAASHAESDILATKMTVVLATDVVAREATRKRRRTTPPMRLEVEANPRVVDKAVPTADLKPVQGLSDIVGRLGRVHTRSFVAEHNLLPVGVALQDRALDAFLQYAAVMHQHTTRQAVATCTTASGKGSGGHTIKSSTMKKALITIETCGWGDPVS
jgi:hypothetical protein